MVLLGRYFKGAWKKKTVYRVECFIKQSKKAIKLVDRVVRVF